MTGISDNAAIGILALIMVGTFSVVAIENVYGTSEFIRSQTSVSVAHRIESGVHAVDAFDGAKLEMDLQTDAGYNIWEDGGGKFLQYNIQGYYPSTQGDPENIIKMNESFGTSYSIAMDESHDPVNTICIVDGNSGVKIEGGEC